MKKWEYSIESVNPMDSVTAVERLDRRGSEGWELVASFVEGQGVGFILKKEIATTTTDFEDN